MVECGGPGLVPGVGSCAKLPHSLSAGEVSRSGHNSTNPLPPPSISNSTKMLAIRVRMLDDNVTLFQVQAKALGKVLFEQVCKQLNLLEADYFGLEYQDEAGIKYWLDLEKCLQRQVGLSLVEPLLQFCVKFYPADPTQLEEEYTRYLFCLQVKRDLSQGHIQCNDNTAALMASYIVQAECGDFVAEDYPDATYLSTYKFVQHQDKELERKIMENHKKHVGQSPAEADLNLLETARRCELYGVKMHPAKDHDGVSLNLAVAHMGILVFINYNKINVFSWAKIRKISFKRKKFLIKLHAEGYTYHKDTVEFFFDTRNECKNLWKKCVEHHGFFRCSSVKRVPRQRARVLSRGSSFRYSGRTQKQIVEYVRENYVKRQTFQRSSPLSRSQSFRQSSSVHSSVANVGGSISAHPLIPLANASIVSSCGSMAGDSPSLICPVDQTIASHSTQPPLSTHPLHTGLPLSYKQYNTTSSQTDIVDIVQRDRDNELPALTAPFSWQRSASCKELRKPPESFEVVDKPANRNFIIAGSKTPSFDRSNLELETKVYSSSYPGTTSSLSTESAEEVEPGGSVLVIDAGSVHDFSHDDLSHDSYELLERDCTNFVQNQSSLESSREGIPNDDDLFVIDNYKDDVEKRLGYVEPRYRDIGFSEFNEKCKQGFARNREQSVEFQEFDAKCKPGLVIGYEEPDVHYPVERTKSDPYVSDFWRVAKQHRRLYHQKSFDLTPDTSGDDRSTNSKSTADIPYSLSVKQNEGRPYECRSPASPKKSPDRRKSDADRKRPTKSHEKLSKTKHNADLNSQDSGLSMSVGTESVDDINEISKNSLPPQYESRTKQSKKNLFKVKSEDAPKKKGSLSKTKALSADSGLRKGGSFEKPPVEVIRIDSEEGEGLVIRRTTEEKISVDTSDPDVIIVEYRGNKRRAFQKRGSSGSKESFEKDKRDSSFEYSVDGSKSQSDKIKDWQNSSKHDGSSDSFTDVEFRRERYSKEVKTSIEGKVVRESKEEREMKKQKSDERVESKEPSISKEADEKENESSYCTCTAAHGYDYKSQDEEIKQIKENTDTSESLDLITPYDEGIKLSCKDDDSPVFDEPSPVHTEAEELEVEKGELTITEVVLEVKAEVAKQMTSPEKAWKKFDELSAAIASKRERSPILFARLGFSEGSVFAPSVQSPSSSRRAKSLDAPVVSLHRLPPITSFSSKDDTVDDDENTEEDRIVCGIIEEVIQEEDSTYLSSGPDSLNKQESPLPECFEMDEKLENKHFFGSECHSLNETSKSTLYEDLGEQEVPRSPKSPLWQKTRKYSDGRMDLPSHSRRESCQSLQDDRTTPPPERRPSTRSERIDSFKNTKNFSVDLWTSDENDVPGVPRVDIYDADLEAYDDAFIDPPEPEQEVRCEVVETQPEEIQIAQVAEIIVCEPVPDDIQLLSNFNFEFMENITSKEDEFNILVTPPRIPSIETSSASFEEPIEVLNISKIPLLELTQDNHPLTKLVPDKRSFDEEPSTSSSLKPDNNNKLKPFSFESSGSSSLEEGIFPLDDSAHFADEEEGSSNSNQDDYPSIGPVGAELILGGYTGGVFGLSRTLSRISERSTTSEQERSDYEDDISTKPSSRSMSVEDESMMSSDRQPSLSSDPSTNLGLEERPLPPLPHEKLDFKIPPPLLPSEEEWPSPPNSNFETPVICHSHVEAFYMDIKGEEPKTMLVEHDSKDEDDEEEDEDVLSDSECENKTLHEDDAPDSSAIENTLKVASRQRKTGNSSDNSLGVSDFSSSTGTTIKHCHYHSNTAKSDDSSLADFGSSLSTEMLASSRKNSDDSGCHKKRKTFFVLQRSFDDYDSPYTESDESSKASHNFIGVAGASGSIHIIKKCPKQEGRRKCCQHEFMEKKVVAPKSLGRSKCYSYYSLARSPPSDGSSSSLDLAEPPLTPNTIPRVSKRRRHIPPSKRRPRILLPELEVRDGGMSASSPSVVTCGKRSSMQVCSDSSKSPMSKQSSV